MVSAKKTSQECPQESMIGQKATNPQLTLLAFEEALHAKFILAATWLGNWAAGSEGKRAGKGTCQCQWHAAEERGRQLISTHLVWVVGREWQHFFVYFIAQWKSSGRKETLSAKCLGTLDGLDTDGRHILLPLSINFSFAFLIQMPNLILFRAFARPFGGNISLCPLWPIWLAHKIGSQKLAVAALSSCQLSQKAIHWFDRLTSSSGSFSYFLSYSTLEF
jgi:hypothetical protein